MVSPYLTQTGPRFARRHCRNVSMVTPISVAFSVMERRLRLAGLFKSMVIIAPQKEVPLCLTGYFIPGGFQPFSLSALAKTDQQCRLPSPVSYVFACLPSNFFARVVQWSRNGARYVEVGQGVDILVDMVKIYSR